jgi:hypothetical protein
MKKGQFKGYILEEVLAYLIRTSGYTLLTSAPPNDPDLSYKHNGLNLRGRGANHQIDVLGELNWIPAFNYPLRLMIEAKFRDGVIGIDVIRSEVGILADVNENYFMPFDSSIKPRYRYVSAVFSTSGFSEPAVDLAIAHQVQLADLSIDEYDGLKQKINEFTDSIFSDNKSINKEQVVSIRNNLRNNLSDSQGDDIRSNEINHACRSLINYVRHDYEKLFIGMSQGGFMLLLKADNPENFISYAKTNPTHDIKIHWHKADGGKKWEIVPMDNSYKLTFLLPKKLHKYIYKIAENKFNEAINQKERHFSKISISYHDANTDTDYIFNLRFSRDNLEMENS